MRAVGAKSPQGASYLGLKFRKRQVGTGTVGALGGGGLMNLGEVPPQEEWVQTGQRRALCPREPLRPWWEGEQTAE